MFDIKQFLEKFRQLRDPLEDKGIIVDIVRSEIGVDILPRSVSFKNGTLFISVDTMIKNALYMRKKEILDKISERFPEKKITDIR